MKSITNAQRELNTLKNDVIGLYKINDKFDLVTYDYGDERFDSITITQFGAIQENFRFPIRYGELKIFPDNKNFNDMLSNPFEFDAFIKSFN